MNPYLQRITTTLALFCISAILLAANKDESTDSKTWQTYERLSREGKELNLPNFSYAGYKNGEEPPVVDFPVFKVTDYGAIANDNLSDQKAIEQTVATAKKTGRGIIFFPPGRFDLNNKAEAAANDNIVVDSSNIVFRGSGTGENGTILFMPHHQEMLRPPLMYSVPYMINFKSNGSTEKAATLAQNAQMGTMSLGLSEVSDLKVNDWVEICLLATDKKAIAAEIAPHALEENMAINNGLEFKTLFKITAIDSTKNTISINIPFPKTIEITNWKTKHFKIMPVIENCGIENLSFEGNWTDKFIHHDPVDGYIDDSGWSAVSFKQVVNGWMRNIRFKNINRALALYRSAQTTMVDLTIEGNNGHWACGLNHSDHNLFVRCKDSVGMHHTWGASSHSVGNVFYKTTALPRKSFDCHGPLVSNTLFDNAEMALTVTWGGPPSNHPNHAQYLMMWNTRVLKSIEPDRDDYSQFRFWRFPDKYGRIVPPVIVGLHGMPVKFAKNQVLIDESNGTRVSPSSLYKAQLGARIETIPKYLK